MDVILMWIIVFVLGAILFNTLVLNVLLWLDNIYCWKNHFINRLALDSLFALTFSGIYAVLILVNLTFLFSIFGIPQFVLDKKPPIPRPHQKDFLYSSISRDSEVVHHISRDSQKHGSIGHEINNLSRPPHPPPPFKSKSLGEAMKFHKEVFGSSLLVFLLLFTRFEFSNLRQKKNRYPIVPEVSESLSLQKIDSKAAQQNTMDHQYRKRFLINMGKKLRSLAVDDIAFFYVENKCCFIKTRDHRSYPIEGSLSQLMEQLNPLDFYRVNRQYIISNKSMVELCIGINGRLRIEMDTRHHREIFVSQDRIRSLKEWLNS